MSKPMNLIYEPMDLEAASPATVSRCGMVYMEPKSMGWRVLLDSWSNNFPEHISVDDRNHIVSLIDWAADYLLEFIRAQIEESSPTQDQNLLQSLFRLFRLLLKDFDSPDFYASFSDVKNRTAVIEGKFVFSLIWSLGGSANTLTRKKIEQEIKRVLSGDIPS
jgi:dynein heavy chain